MSRKKVVVGMSGGVDSSVCAYLLKEQGYEVIGVTCNFWWDGAKSDIEDARKIAAQLGIEYHVYDFVAGFRKNVMEPFIDSYLCAMTPNPCALCNRTSKWKSLLMAADLYGAEYVATGHYAFIDRLENGRYSVRNADDSSKDQSYVLYNLTQEQLSRTLMPLGPYTKDEIRSIAGRENLPVAHKHDSQDICFFYGNDYAGFICEEAPGKIPPEGNFVSPDGTVLGKHKGIIHYTIGQRKGLGIALGRPVFVSKIDPVKNEVTLADEDAVFSDTLEAECLNYMGEDSFDPEKTYYGKTRYTHKGTPCHVSMISDSSVRVTFDSPVRAATPGQAMVLYDGPYIAGGGIIVRVGS